MAGGGGQKRFYGKPTTDICPFGHLQKVNQYLTQSKPYKTLAPLNGGVAGRPDIRADLSSIQAVSFPGYNTGEGIFQARHGESLKKVYYGECGV